MINKSPRCFLASLESIGLSVNKTVAILDSSFLASLESIGLSVNKTVAILGFTIGTILAVFDLQVTPMLPTMFGVNWLLGLGEEVKNRFSR